MVIDAHRREDKIKKRFVSRLSPSSIYRSIAVGFSRATTRFAKPPARLLVNRRICIRRCPAAIRRPRKLTGSLLVCDVAHALRTRACPQNVLDPFLPWPRATLILEHVHAAGHFEQAAAAASDRGCAHNCCGEHDTRRPRRSFRKKIA